MIKDGTALLIERNMELTESNILVPDGTSEKKYIIKGIFMQSDVKNRNGRVYQNISWIVKQHVIFKKRYVPTKP